jgi:general secretion pathway protein G
MYPINKLLPRGSNSVDSRGFTLIELLTVIAIIGILAAILIPVVGKVRDSARASLCLSNLRQISMAILMYADENQGVIPTAGGINEGEQATDWILWRGALNGDGTFNLKLSQSAIVDYLGGSFSPEIYQCPSDERLGGGQRPAYPFSYTLNRALGEGTGTADFTQLGGRIHNVADPSLIIMMVEEKAPNDSSAWLADATLDTSTERHGGRGHVSFVDGHVETVYPEYVNYAGHWDPFAPPGRPYNGRR